MRSPRIGYRVTALVAGLLLVGTACGSTSPTGSDAATEQTRTVQTAMGPVDVPATPERVVVLDIGELDSLLTLGVKPVGAVRAAVSEGFPDYLPGSTEGIKIVGTIGSPDLEAIHALNPDLILSSKTRDEDHYEDLKRIAPTVLAERVGGVWQENFLLDAEAIGKKAEAEKVLADFDARAKEIGTKLGDPSSITASVLRFTGTEIRAYCQASFLGTILTKVGFARPASQSSSGSCESTNGTWSPVSPEKLTEADGDYLFWSTYGPVDKSKEPQTTASPLWKSLKAVANGTAPRVNDDYWFTGVGPSAAQHVLDDMDTLFSK
ncbi:MAG TPA: iron-siderophore ABC transporter substrate-binding protein [Mycobacteriales bacterium]